MGKEHQAPREVQGQMRRVEGPVSDSNRHSELVEVMKSPRHSQGDRLAKDSGRGQIGF